MEQVLELTGVSKSFNKKQVLSGVNLSVGRGRVVGLLGKNGAGKTTLLKCALGLLRVTSGESKVFGENSWDLSGDVKARIGYVPQKIDLYPWMRVRQMISYIAAFYSTWNAGLSSSLLKKWELNGEERVGTLSEGQVQKLALILALGHEPELLILDEPAASLDPQARRTFLSAVVEIASDQNRTVVLSTHLTTDVERVASDVVLLKSGEIYYSGPMDDLKDRIKSLKLTAAGRLPGSFDFPGLLSSESRENHALLTVRGVDDALIQRLESKYGATVEARDLTLEDIFVEVHRD